MGSDGSLPTWFRLNANFNPRSPDGERRSDHCRCHYRPEISIHAPRMGSDYAPLICFNVCSIFQSTLPGWGATFQTTVKIPLLHYFNPRSPDGERPHSDHRILLARDNFNPRSPDGERLCGTMNTPSKKQDFNPRSPDGERQTQLYLTTTTHTFQSTLPGWGATCGKKITLQRAFISIHAPRMGSDSWKCRP